MSASRIWALLLVISMQSCEHDGDTTSYIRLPTHSKISLSTNVRDDNSFYQTFSDVHGILASGEVNIITRYGDSLATKKQRWVAGNFQNTKQQGAAPGTIYLNSQQRHFRGEHDIQNTDSNYWNADGINTWQISATNAAASRAFEVHGKFPVYKAALPATISKDHDYIIEFNPDNVQHADRAFVMCWNMGAHYTSPIVDASNGRIVIPADRITRLQANHTGQTRFNLVLFSNRIHPYGLKHIATPVVSEYTCWVEIK